MRMEEIDRALGETPAEFSRRIDQTLRALKEEQHVKRFTLRMALVTALLIALLCGVAYAVVTQGMEWYYSNRFTAYQVHEPEKYEAILDNLQTVVTRKEDSQVQVTVQEVAWAEEQRFMTVALAAVPSHPEEAELHPMWNLDADGAYVGPDFFEGDVPTVTEDGIDRAEHWLWTKKGFGSVREVMDSPEKELLLFEADSVYLETTQGAVNLRGDGSSMDSFVGEGGEVITVLEVQLDWMQEDYDAEIRQRMEGQPDMRDYWMRRLEEVQLLRDTLNGSADGMISLVVPYTVTAYTENDAELYGGGEQNQISFQLKIR